jgi:hypothetical protein
MKNITNQTPMLPGFYMPLRGRKPRSAQQVFADRIATRNLKKRRGGQNSVITDGQFSVVISIFLHNDL